MSLDDEQLEQPTEGNAELSNHGDLSDEELLAQLETNPNIAFQPVTPDVDTDDNVQPLDDADPADVLEDDQADTATDTLETDPLEDAEPTATETEIPVEAQVEQPPKAEVTAEDTTDYKAFHDQVTAQFKANGRELKVSNPADIIALMQQGANYDKKMSSLKPAMQVHRTLEKAGLLDPEKIGFLIDLHHGKPEAIAKLIADHEIDTYSLEGKSEGYVPQAHMASEQEVAISSVMQELNSAPDFDKTFDRLGRWDEASQQKILDRPEMLRYYQEHKEAGIFDQIHNAIESERMFGRLRGVSDYEAYQLVGDQLFGKPQQAQVQAQPLTQRPVVQPVQQQVVVPPTPISDPRVEAKKAQLNQKRSAASAPRKVAQGQAQEQFNPLAVSDEELLQIAERNTRLM